MEETAVTTNGHTNGLNSKAPRTVTPEELSLQTELAAMRRINRVLEPLNAQARRRVLVWALERINAAEQAQYTNQLVGGFADGPKRAY